jgi:LysR family hydrogen peroxide-inducible transcriptional activator
MNSLRDYTYLIAVSEMLHFGKAAEICHVSQPTLSGQLRKMEKLLGFNLFERTNRKVTITHKGKQMVSIARDIVAAQESFQEKARELVSPFSGELHLGLIPSLAPYLLPHIMPALHKKYENMNFYLYEHTTDELLSLLVNGKLDALILQWLPEMDSFHCNELFDEALLLALPERHALVDKKNLSLSDLNGQQVLTLQDGHCLREQTLGYCISSGAKEDSNFSATSLETLRYMLSTGDGITLLPELAVYKRSDNNIVYRRFESDAPTRQIVLLTRTTFGNKLMIKQIAQCVQKVIEPILISDK